MEEIKKARIVEYAMRMDKNVKMDKEEENK